MLFTQSDSEAHDVIDRFVEVLSAAPPASPDRLHDVGFFVSISIGGNLTYRFPMPEHGLPPGSIGEELHSSGDFILREEWLELLRQRLLDLVNDGMDAAFLVRSLVHYVTDWLEHLAATGEADNNRTRERQRMLTIANNPEILAEYYRSFTERNPGTEASREDVANGLRRLAEHFLPISADEAAKKWAALETWRSDAAEFLAAP